MDSAASAGEKYSHEEDADHGMKMKALSSLVAGVRHAAEIGRIPTFS